MRSNSSLNLDRRYNSSHLSYIIVISNQNNCYGSSAGTCSAIPDQAKAGG